MIIHIWMHWFWITTTNFRGFLLFAIQMISFVCISQPYVTEAGLLHHETLIPDISYSYNNSSHLGHYSNITLPIDERSHPSETPLHQLSPISSQDETNAEESTTLKPEDGQRISFGSASDMEDTYNGGTLDVFQYPMKKFTKYSHLKYGKVKPKGKANEETGGEERKSESIKVIDEKINVNASIKKGEGDHLGPEVEKSNESLSEGRPSVIPTSDAPDLITTTIAEIMTSEEKEGFEQVSKVEMNITDDSSTKKPVVSLGPTEEQNVSDIFKNETLVIESKVEERGPFTTVEPFAVKNRVAAATSAQNSDTEQTEMNAGSITGITLGILVIFSLFGAVSFVLYRRRYLNKPQVLNDKCSNLDSSGYIDETSLRENSEEMYSLDNDSFLNSLEAMTIQNYWTESVKHTKL